MKKRIFFGVSIFSLLSYVSISLGQEACQLVQQGFGSEGSTPVRVETLVSGLETPWGIGFLPDGDYLVTERPGRIRIVRQSKLDPTPVAEVETAEPGEGGLLGIAVHPQFESNRFFYVYYTANKQGKSVNRVERFRLSENKASATFDKIIIDDIPAAARHNGGRILFGPDEHLYIGTGDAAQPSLSQQLDSPAGKLLRLTPDGGIPEDNPWPGNPAYLLGIRNTQGFDWLDENRLLISDHGPSGELGRTGHDEVSIAVKGQNLGWPDVWRCNSAPGFVTPLIVWQQALPPGGAIIYQGTAIPNWKGNLIIGALGSEHLQRIVLDTSEPVKVLTSEVYFGETANHPYGRLREVISAPNGDLLVTTSNCDGRGNCPEEGDLILRIQSS